MRLNVNDLYKSFDDKKVLQGATFSFEKGKIYGLLGRNGAGKTTLFNAISHEMSYESGSIDLNGQPIDFNDLGYAFSSPILPEFLTGYEFIRFYLDLHKDRVENSLTIEQYASIVHLSIDDLYRLIKDYSHGMKNKLQMLCLFIARPSIILLDEPLTSLDIVVAYEIKELLLRLKENHIIILSTHILQLAKDLCDEIVLLHHGLLQGLDSTLLESEDFEKELIEALKDESTI